MNKYKKIISVLLVVVAISIFISSCGGPKKCNGKRGTRVDMGVM